MSAASAVGQAPLPYHTLAPSPSSVQPTVPSSAQQPVQFS